MEGSDASMKLIHVVQEAARTGEYSRLSTRQAKQVIRAMAEYFEIEAFAARGSGNADRLETASRVIRESL
jgi:hypothetical protein